MRRKTTLTTLLLAATVILTGCGGSNGSGGGNPPPNGVAGNYEGSTIVEPGLNAFLGFSLNTDGTAVGFLATSDTVIPTAFSTLVDGFEPTIYDISGELDDNGVLKMVGVAGALTFRVEAYVSHPSASSFMVKVDGAESGVLGTMAKVTEAPRVNFKMRQITTTNADFSDMGDEPIVTSVSDGDGYKLLKVTETVGSAVREIEIKVPNDMNPGQVRVLNSTPGAIRYKKFSTLLPGVQTWDSTTAAISLVAREDHRLAVILSEVVFAPVDGTGSTGTFRVAGTLHN